MAIVPGAIVLPSVGADAVTVRLACAGPVLPALVDSVPVVLVTVPGVLDVTGTTIVQLPGAMTVPDATVIEVALVATPAQLPVLAPVMVTQMLSVNASELDADAVRVAGASVSVTEPPSAMVPERSSWRASDLNRDRQRRRRGGRAATGGVEGARGVEDAAWRGRRHVDDDGAAARGYRAAARQRDQPATTDTPRIRCWASWSTRPWACCRRSCS